MVLQDHRQTKTIISPLHSAYGHQTSQVVDKRWEAPKKSILKKFIF